MPYELFWHLNPAKLKPFKMAYQKKLVQDDYHAWLQGIYIRTAVGSVMDHKKCRYPVRPMSMEEKESALSGEEKFLLWIDEFNRRFDQAEE